MRRDLWPSLLAACLLCQALAASSAVTISLRPSPDADVAQADALISDLLDSPTRRAAQGLLSYRSESWSARRDIQSRRGALDLLKTAWGSALEVREDEPAGPLAPPVVFRHGDFSRASQAALAIIPASLLAGRHGQAYDNQFAAEPAATLAVALPAAPARVRHLKGVRGMPSWPSSMSSRPRILLFSTRFALKKHASARCRLGKPARRGPPGLPPP